MHAGATKPLCLQQQAPVAKSGLLHLAAPSPPSLPHLHKIYGLAHTSSRGVEQVWEVQNDNLIVQHEALGSHWPSLAITALQDLLQ